MKKPKPSALEIQISQVQKRIEMAIANDHARLAANHAKLLESLIKLRPPEPIKSAQEIASENMAQRRKDKDEDEVMNILLARLAKIKARQLADEEANKNRIG